MSNVTTKTQESSLASAWKLTLVFMLAVAAVMLPEWAYATGTDTPIGNVFCTVVGWFTGNTGKGLATIAITIIGIGALLGKVSWGMALIVGLGVAIVFGAVGIVDAMNVSGVSIGSGCTTTATVFR